MTFWAVIAGAGVASLGWAGYQLSTLVHVARQIRSGVDEHNERERRRDNTKTGQPW